MSGIERGEASLIRQHPSRLMAATIIRPHPDRHPANPEQPYWEVWLPDGTLMGTFPEDKFFEFLESLSAGRESDSKEIPDPKDDPAMIERSVAENRPEPTKEKAMRNWSKVGLISAVATVLMVIFLIPWVQQFVESFSDSTMVAAAEASDSDEGRSFAEAVTGEDESLHRFPIGDVYVVEKGDALERLAGKDMLAVAHMSGVENPDKIFPGQLLLAPVGVKFHRRGFRIVDCSATAKGYCLYSNPGADPMCKVRDPLKALTSPREYGLSADEAITVIGGAGERVILPAGTVLTDLSFGHGHWKGPVILKKDMRAYRLADIDGQRYLRFEVCCNLARMPAPARPIKVEAVPEARPVVEPPQPQPTPASAALVEPPVPQQAPQEPEELVGEMESQSFEEPATATKAAPSCLDWDTYIGAGGDASGTRYVYIDGAAYLLCKEGENGKHFLGVGWKANYALGETDGFDWKGRMNTLGLAHKYVDYDGWDITTKLLWGELQEKGAISEYRSNAESDIWGVSSSLNWYERHLHGERWFPETNVNAGVYWPLSTRAHHSWAGSELDPGNLGTFDYKWELGVRQYLYAGDNLWPFVSGGLSGQEPVWHSGNLRLGVTDANRIFFASVGINRNLDDGENVFGWDIGIDVARGVKLARAEARRKEMLKKLEENGVVFNEATGALIIPSGEITPTTVKSVTKTQSNNGRSSWGPIWDWDKIE